MLDVSGFAYICPDSKSQKKSRSLTTPSFSTSKSPQLIRGICYPVHLKMDGWNPKKMQAPSFDF